MERFMVVQHNNVWRVVDTEYVQLKQPSDLAVAIYFKYKLRAEQICNMMNAEWQEFLADPDGEEFLPMAEKVDRVMKVLNDGPSCYAQRREVIMAVIKQHEKEFEEERAAEAALWEMPLDDEWFNERWKMLADAGHVDSFDGHECRVAFRAWAAAGRQRTYIFASPLDEDSVMREADARESRAKEAAAKIRTLREKEWIDATS